jgi:superfamily II DNA/RNA helicase
VNTISHAETEPELFAVLAETEPETGPASSAPIPKDGQDARGDAHFGHSDLCSETFRSLYADHLPSWLVDKIEECGWTHPTTVQRQTLDAFVVKKGPRNTIVGKDGQDVTSSSKVCDAIVRAETGSGKTLAYLLPCLAGIDPSRKAVQALIVVPTRELGLQVARITKRLVAGSGSASPSSPLTSATDDKIMVMSVLQGSQNRRQRAWAWAEPPHCVIGTPAELCDMIRYGGIRRCNSIAFLVVDEVDACLLSNSGGKIAAGASANALATSGTPLHELLSRYLSPTYDDGRDFQQNGSNSDSFSTSLLTATSGNSKLSTRPSQQRQTIFCSATIPQHRHFVKQCVQNQWMLNDPINICSRAGEQLLPLQLEHAVIVCSSPEKKLAALRRLIKKLMASTSSAKESSEQEDGVAGEGSSTTTVARRNKKVLIFAETQRPFAEMAKAIAKDVNGIYWTEQTARRSATLTGSSSSPLRGGKEAIVSVLRFEDSLSERAAAMEVFRGEEVSSRSFHKSSIRQYPSSPSSSSPLLPDEAQEEEDPVRLRVLLSTDLAARGLDIADITHVVHFDLPDSADTYVHRAGRSGRFGRPGRVLSIVTRDQEFVLDRICNKLQVELQCAGRQRR